MDRLPKELCKVRAIYYLVCALNSLKQSEFNRAYTSYGQALAYEEAYDTLESNQEVNSLYKDCPEYKNLCHEWARLTNVTNS